MPYLHQSDTALYQGEEKVDKEKCDKSVKLSNSLTRIAAKSQIKILLSNLAGVLI